jgi:hypothetical protein
MTRHYSIGLERPGAIAVLDLTPAGRYYGGEPYYHFHTTLPAGGVRALPELATDDPEAAFLLGVAYAKEYERNRPMAGMAEVLGVTKVPEGYAPVVNTFYSNT